ncbi:phage holin family protein [Mucilaginibacter antarcticus]|uniref:Phage holin family protein n=1 Tax=Mucilaginibacter antarcticus TaxID=1855725 RepID=A0ABW5XPY5_9SPHI
MEQEVPKEEQPQPSLIDQIKEYIEIRIKLAKYKAVDSSSTVIASIIADLVVIISMLLAFLFASFTLALFLGHVLHSNWQGFGCVALLYLIIALLLKFNKLAFERPIANAIVKTIFKPKEKENE